MSRRSTLVSVAIVAVAFACGVPAASQPASPDATAAARELLTTMRMADQVKVVLPLLMKHLKPAFAQGRPEVERDIDAMMPHLLEIVDKRSAELIEAAVPIYVRHFTAEEMRQLTAFYREPLGQKLLEKQPVIAQESMAVGQLFGKAVAAELQARIVDELRKRGHKI